MRLAVGGLLFVWTAAAATVVHRPYLQNMQPDGVTVMWSTRESLSSTVQYSTDNTFSTTSTPAVRMFPASGTNSVTFYQYRAVLTGLSPNTSYNYRVIAGGQDITSVGEHTFRTTPPTGAYRFLAFGDSGLGSQQQIAIARMLAAEPASLVLHVGDIAYESGTFDEFRDNYFEIYWPMMARVPFFPVPGNHEYYTNNAAPFLALSAPPSLPGPAQDQGRYYSYDWGDVHFIALDANLLVPPFSSAAQLAWLEQDLVATNAKWKVAYWHQVPYPVEHHIDDPICIAARQQFVPILERHGVQLVLTGHEHNYLRMKPMRASVPVSSGPSTQYVSSGGGGGGLHPVVAQPWLEYGASAYNYLTVDVDAAQLTVRAVGLDGKEFDRVVLAQPSISDGGVVNGASFTTSLAPGELVSIFGKGLATQTFSAQSYPLPTVVGGASVMLNGTPLPLIYVSPGQINAQLPLDVRGSATLVASTLAGTSQASVTISDTAPAVFPFGVLHADGRAVSTTAPAAPGETLVIYMTGLGQVNGSIAAGQPAPASPLLSVTSDVQVMFGPAGPLKPSFAGLTPGFVGVYQVNVTVPSNLATNTYPVRVLTTGNASPPTNV
ncbi:MAG TPA: metallophosphoesterase, partial [Candidatus Acidoferrum sp.]|nr:metallophosphoesterase [Candidatus Acidoferrum sp.]